MGSKREYYFKGKKISLEDILFKKIPARLDALGIDPMVSKMVIISMQRKLMDAGCDDWQAYSMADVCRVDWNGNKMFCADPGIKYELRNRTRRGT